MEIKPAKQSPRLSGQIFKWYNGDAFSIEWNFAITVDDEPFTFSPEDKVSFNFFNFEKEPVYTFNFTNVQNNKVTLNFTKEISAKFTPGNYSYCVKLEHAGEIVTLHAKERVEVERCH